MTRTSEHWARAQSWRDVPIGMFHDRLVRCPYGSSRARRPTVARVAHPVRWAALRQHGSDQIAVVVDPDRQPGIAASRLGEQRVVALREHAGQALGRADASTTVPGAGVKRSSRRVARTLSVISAMLASPGPREPESWLYSRGENRFAGPA